MQAWSRKPLVTYLLERGFEVTVCEQVVAKARKLTQGWTNGKACALDAADPTAIDGVVQNVDLAISLLPAPMHPNVAKACLKHAKHMVTASYVSPQMRGLERESRERDVLLLNEIGVDPGIDHMSAMQVIDQKKRQGATLIGFSSWCGGLPDPQACDNPFLYKFSWSPKAVLVAARNSARYLKEGKLVEIPPDDLFLNPKQVEIPGVGMFEGYPNRDSVSYLDTYGFDKTKVRSVFRGTLRHVGHCLLYRQLIALGLIEEQPILSTVGHSYRSLLEEWFGSPLRELMVAKLGVHDAQPAFEALSYIGMLSEDNIKQSEISLMDLMADRMAQTLVYQKDERDMLLMRHDLTFEYDDGRRERVTAVMVDYGIVGGDSAMARTVALPAAIAARLILQGKISLRGVQIPIDPQIYKPVLEELAQLGIGFTESVSSL